MARVESLAARGGARRDFLSPWRRIVERACADVARGSRDGISIRPVTSRTHHRRRRVEAPERWRLRPARAPGHAGLSPSLSTAEVAQRCAGVPERDPEAKCGAGWIGGSDAVRRIDGDGYRFHRQTD